MFCETAAEQKNMLLDLESLVRQNYYKTYSIKYQYDCYDNRIYVGVEKLSVDSLREISDNGVSG